MKKIIPFLFVAVNIIAVSCTKEEHEPEVSGDSGIYRVMFEVTGEDPRGNTHIITLDGVNIKNEMTGQSSSSIDESFSQDISYVTESEVQQIAIQGVLYSNEYAELRMKVTKDGCTVFDESKGIDPQNGTDKTIELRYTTLGQ